MMSMSDPVAFAFYLAALVLALVSAFVTRRGDPAAWPTANLLLAAAIVCAALPGLVTVGERLGR